MTELMNIGGHSVDTRHKQREECPACERTTTWYCLGSTDDVVGWVCGRCKASLDEIVEDGEPIGVEVVIND